MIVHEVENELGAFKEVSKDDVRDALDSGDEVSIHCTIEQ